MVRQNNYDEQHMDLYCQKISIENETNAVYLEIINGYISCAKEIRLTIKLKKIEKINIIPFDFHIDQQDIAIDKHRYCTIP